MFYLGIDQHARQLTVNLRGQNGDVRLRKQVSTRPAKVIRFFEELTACCAASGCGFWGDRGSLWLYRDKIAGGKPIKKLRIVKQPNSIQLRKCLSPADRGPA